MKKIAVFGKPANGKSTLSKRLALALGIRLYSLDSILYEANGKEVDRAKYEAAHKSIISSDEWLVEGFGPLDSLNSFYKRLEAADTLIYIDLPYSVTYWLVTKRFFKGLIRRPIGWPEGSSIFEGTINTFRILKLCPQFWNDRFLHKLQSLNSKKKIFVIRSISELNSFVNEFVHSKRATA